MLSSTSGHQQWSSSLPRTSSHDYWISCLNSNLLEDPLRYKLVGTGLTITGQKRTFGSNFVKHYTMSSPMHTRSGTSLLPISFQPQSPYRLTVTVPATLTTTTATTSTSSSTEISSTAPSVVFSTALAQVIRSVSTSSTVLVSAMSTVITSPSTVTLLVASVTSASSASSTATDPGIPGPGSFFGDNTQDPRSWITNFQSWSNQHVVHDTAQSVFPPRATASQTTDNGQPLPSTRPQRTRYTFNQSPRQFPSQGAQQLRTAWNRQNRQPFTSGEQQQCYRCLKNHPFRHCSFVNSKCFYCGVTGHIKAACRRRLASQISQQSFRATLTLHNYSKNSNQFYEFRELHPKKQNSEQNSNFLVSTSLTKNYIEARVNRHFSKILLDTGSTFSLTHADFVENIILHLPVQEASQNQIVVTACGKVNVLSWNMS